jgi:hypothetical protein
LLSYDFHDARYQTVTVGFEIFEAQIGDRIEHNLSMVKIIMCRRQDEFEQFDASRQPSCSC